MSIRTICICYMYVWYNYLMDIWYIYIQRQSWGAAMRSAYVHRNRDLRVNNVCEYVGLAALRFTWYPCRYFSCSFSIFGMPSRSKSSMALSGVNSLYCSDMNLRFVPCRASPARFPPGSLDSHSLEILKVVWPWIGVKSLISPMWLWDVVAGPSPPAP